MSSAQHKIQTNQDLRTRSFQKIPSQVVNTYEHKPSHTKSLVASNKSNEEYISWGAVTFGSTEIANISSNTTQYLGNMLLQFTISSGTKTIYANPGFSCIDFIEVTVPGCSQKYRVDRESLFYACMDDCNTEDKRDKVISEAGGSADITNPSNDVTFTVPLYFLNLKLPFQSDYSGAKYFPMHKINNSPLQLLVKFSSQSNILSSGSDTSFSEVKLIWEKYALEDLMYSPNIYNEPSTLAVYDYEISKLSYTASDSSLKSVRLSGLRRNKELIKLIVSSVQDSNLPARFEQGDKINDMQLTDGGIELYLYHAGSSRLFNLIHKNDLHQYTYKGSKRYFESIALTANEIQDKMISLGMNIYQDDLELKVKSDNTNASKLLVTAVFRDVLHFHDGIVTIHNY